MEWPYRGILFSPLLVFDFPFFFFFKKKNTLGYVSFNKQFGAPQGTPHTLMLPDPGSQVMVAS